MNSSAVPIHEGPTPFSLGWTGHSAGWHWTKKPQCASLSPLVPPSPKMRWDEALISCCGWFLPCLSSVPLADIPSRNVEVWHQVSPGNFHPKQLSALTFVGKSAGCCSTALWCHRDVMLLPPLSTYQGLRAYNCALKDNYTIIMPGWRSFFKEFSFGNEKSMIFK